MLKRHEQSDPSSCLNKAHPDERIFVLLGRDPAAPFAIRQWAQERCRLSKNRFDDLQIVEALDCADQMESER